MNYNKAFETLIKQGISLSQQVTDPEKAATICAKLALAIAESGLIDATIQVAPEKVKEAIAEDSVEVAPKAVPAEDPLPEELPKEQTEQKEAPPAPAPPAPEPVEETAEAATPAEEWNDQTIAQFAEQLDFIGNLKEQYGEEGQAILDDCVRDYSEGVFQSTDDITPANILGFENYLKMLLAEAQAE